MRIGAGVAVLALALAGCTGTSGSDLTGPTDTTPATIDLAEDDAAEEAAEHEPAEPTDSGDAGEPGESPADDTAGAFPDPATVVGAEVVVESPADGGRMVVDGVPLAGLAQVFGACFAPTASEPCPYSMSGLQPGDASGAPVASSSALLVLLQLTGRAADGTAVWVGVDAQVVDLGAEVLVESCVGAEDVAIAPAGISGSTVLASAAWGANAARTAIVEVDPSGLSCEALGD
ncbi:hypothetical protein OEB99_00340 [Actinotalea sp. M2MS4P-6]|uniref:hypothetical protein n=1 Tax=Actinotalea sp. M2MS4P-6 TaxID=2983762 RepID=UPI0021E3C322|nr:hypothetical protein [Actinotalea sp. M2MS4P-6]MCV2392746.1 hypothetical protein [Actinotalea sp. M2MS4P-6]